MFNLPLFPSHNGKHRPPQPFSGLTLEKAPRTAGATLVESVCPYCAVGCGLHIYTKAGKVIDIEGNPRSPINEGTLCPKGANTFQLPLIRTASRTSFIALRTPPTGSEAARMGHGPHRREGQADARRGFTAKDEQGRLMNSVRNMGTLGGATLDNEENYLIKKLFGAGLGVVSIENQARI